MNFWKTINLPTWITLSRLLGVPIVLYLLQGEPDDRRRWWACGLFLVTAATDWLDGYLARRLNQVTDLGKFLDPLVDKLLVLAPLMSLVEWGRLPAWGVFLILARELTIAGWRVSPQQTAQGVQGASGWGKVKTLVQIAAIALLIAPLPSWGSQAGTIAFWIALALTWISGWLYLQPPQATPLGEGAIPKD